MADDVIHKLFTSDQQVSVQQLRMLSLAFYLDRINYFAVEPRSALLVSQSHYSLTQDYNLPESQLLVSQILIWRHYLSLQFFANLFLGFDFKHEKEGQFRAEIFGALLNKLLF